MQPRILALSAALALAVPAVHSNAYAQPAPTKAQQQEAATRFKKGLELFKEGDYQAALIEFRRANELAPNYNVLYNIGQVYFQLQDYPNALTALQKYMEEGGSAVPASRRADVQRDIDKLKARVANVEMVTTVPDAEITIDDISVGRTPLSKPIMVSAGRHKITVSKSGFTATTKVIEIASGDALKVPIDPVEQKNNTTVVTPPPPPQDQPPAPPQTSAPIEPPPPPPSKPVPVAGIVVTSALTVGAVVTGILALGAKSSLQDEIKNPAATRDSLDSAKSKTTGLGLATDILAGSAVIALGVTLYVGLSGPSSPKKEKDATAKLTLLPERPGSTISNVRFGVGPGSVVVTGNF